MLIALGMISSVILLLMGLKLLRTVQEYRSSQAGYITFGGDDRYQAQNEHINVHDAVMAARVKFEMSDAAFQVVIDRVQENYLRWYEKLESSIQRRPQGKPFGLPLEIRDEYREPELDDTPLLCRIIISRNDHVILLLGNHVYLGGYLLAQFVQLVFCKAVCKQVFPRNRYIPVVSELMMLALFGRLVLRPRHARSEVYTDKSKIQRFYVKEDLAAIDSQAAALGMHHLYLVIASHVFVVMKRMRKDRLRVTLPVSFENETTFNTVGGVFLDIDAEPDVERLAKTIRRLVKRNQWQASASNHIQRVFPTRKLSAKARNMVDLTLTVVPQKTLPENLLGREMQDYEFTMDSIHYPVYVMAFIFEGHVHSSFMINTPDFDVESFMTEDRARPMEGISLEVRKGGAG